MTLGDRDIEGFQSILGSESVTIAHNSQDKSFSKAASGGSQGNRAGCGLEMGLWRLGGGTATAQYSGGLLRHAPEKALQGCTLQKQYKIRENFHATPTVYDPKYTWDECRDQKALLPFLYQASWRALLSWPALFFTWFTSGNMPHPSFSPHS